MGGRHRATGRATGGYAPRHRIVTPPAEVDVSFGGEPPALRPLVAAAFGWDLPGCTVAAPDEPLGPAAWSRVFASVHRQRGDSALAWAIAEGWWPATEAQRRAAYDAHRQNMALAVLLERELLALHDRWSVADAVAGTPGAFRAPRALRVLKGAAVAHLDEPDPSRRAFGDLDVLVAADDLAAIERLLQEDGGRRRYPEPRPGFDRRFSKGMSFTFDRNCEIDVHRTLASGAFGLSIDVRDLFAASEPFEVGGRTLHALDRPNRFLHAAYHALLGGQHVRLNALRDLVHTQPVDDEQTRVALGRARRWHGEAVVARSVLLAARWFGWQPRPLLHAWAEGFTPTDRDRRWLAAYVGPGRSYAGQMLVGLEAVPGVRDRLAYAVGNARSPGSHPADHRWRRGLRALRHSVST